MEAEELAIKTGASRAPGCLRVTPALPVHTLRIDIANRNQLK
jgi:hypothetical protein